MVHVGCYLAECRNRAVLKAPTIAASFYHVDTSAGQRSRSVSISSTIQPVVHSVNVPLSDSSANPVADLCKPAHSSTSFGSNVDLPPEGNGQSSDQVVAVTSIAPGKKANSSGQFKPGDACGVPTSQLPAFHNMPYRDTAVRQGSADLQRSRSESSYQEVRHQNSVPGVISTPKIFRPFPKQNTSRHQNRVVVGMYSDKSSAFEDTAKRRASLHY